MLDKAAGKEVKVRAQIERYITIILRNLHKLEKLSHHKFSEHETGQMFSALNSKLEEVEAAFTTPPEPTQPQFKFQ